MVAPTSSDSVAAVLASFVPQLETGLTMSLPSLDDKWRRLLICGMGGSGLAGLLLQQYLRALRKDCINLHRDYGLPPSIVDSVLIVISSYSGNTEEMLASLDVALRTDEPIVTISTGGTLEQRAKETETPNIHLNPPDIPHFQPRHSVPLQFGVLVSLLAATTDINIRDDLLSALTAIDPASLANQAQSVAAAVESRTPLIYTASTLSAVGYNWKIQCNETAKVHAFHNVLPEVNHNELAAENDNAFIEVLIRDTDDHARVRRRFALLHEMYPSSILIDLPGSTLLERTLNGILLGWQVAFTLAEKRNVDPFAVETIEVFKQKLSSP